MEQTTSNVVLIGMPGCGKSTVGVVLAKRLSYEFVDTDLLIQSSRQRSLQDIVDREGYLALRAIEEDVLLTIESRNSVIATGGSAVYSDRAMAHLAALGTIVFLEIDFPTLERRINDVGTRGLARRPDQGLADLFAERAPLYRRFAQITVNCCGLTQEAIADKVAAQIPSRQA